MFEGKHIHFSPLDNKPLCSYSSKLCRQRRLNGYAFCIRHILEDKSAPFKQCGFVTRNNYQKCLNAIPSNQERGYCHSHMQVAGIIPKTERKNRIGSLPPVAGSSPNSEATPEASPVTATVIKCSALSDNEKKEKIAVQDAKSGSQNESKTVTNNVPKNNSSGLKRMSVKGKSYLATSIVSSVKIHGGKSAVDVQIGETEKKIRQYGILESTSNTPCNAHKETPFLKNSLHKVGKEVTSENSNKTQQFSQAKLSNCVPESAFFSNLRVEPVNACCNPIYTLCVRDRWKRFRFNSQEDAAATKSSLKLKRMKAVQVLEKLPLFMEVPAENTNPTHQVPEIGKRNESVSSFVSSGVEVVLFPPLVNKKKLGGSDPPKLNGTSGSEKKKSHNFPSEKGEMLCDMKVEDFQDKGKLWEWESRKDFLSRVRQAFKRQYKTMMKVCKLKEKMQRSDRAFRSALLSCAVHDTSMCAQILSKGDPKFESSAGSLLPLVKFDYGRNPCEKDFSGKPETDLDFPTESKSKTLSSSNQNTNSSYVNLIPRREEDFRGVVKKDVSLDTTKIKASTTADSLIWQQQAVMEQKSLKCKKRVHKETERITRPGSPRSKQITAVKENKRNAPNVEKDSSKKKCKKGTPQPNGKKRRLECSEHDLASSDAELLGENDQLGANLVAATNDNYLSKDLLNADDRMLGATCSASFQANLENVLHSVSSSEAATTPEGVITDTSFDSPFNHSTSSHPDCEFSDDDLEKSFELQIDPEIAHQASRLLEDNGLTEDDFNELFPETRVGDQKLAGRADLGDLGIDFTSNFDATDIDYSLFANIFPNFRSNQHESISVHHQF